MEIHQKFQEGKKLIIYMPTKIWKLVNKLH